MRSDWKGNLPGQGTPVIPHAQDRRDAAERMAIAGGLFAAATGVRRLRVRGARPMGEVAREAFHGRTVPSGAGRSAATAAGKFAARRGAQAAGVSLAYTGARDFVHPSGRGRADLQRDIVRPAVHAATGQDIVQRQQRRWDDAAVRKSAGLELTDADRKNLIRRKRRAAHIAEVGGTLGVAAGALRAPQILRGVQRVAPAVGTGRTASRVLAAEPRLTSASNTVGVASIAAGSAGAFNSAGVQRREASSLSKSARYMRAHADRVSPQAEDAYHRLRNDRNAGYGGTVLNGLAAAGSADYARDALKQGRRGWGALGVAATVASTIAARNSLKGARRKQSRMRKIENKAHSREAAGLYGPGRGKEPVDQTSARANLVAKAGLLGLPSGLRAARTVAPGARPAQFGRALPVGVARAARPRQGTIRRVPSGGAVTVRGGLG